MKTPRRIHESAHELVDVIAGPENAGPRKQDSGFKVQDLGEVAPFAFQGAAPESAMLEPEREQAVKPPAAPKKRRRLLQL